jgi:hypothetical protein
MSRTVGLGAAIAASGCGGALDWPAQKAELIAETSVITTTFEHKDA